MSVNINPNARNRALSLGKAGELWIEQLDDTVHKLLHRWKLSLGKTFPEGTASFAAEVFDKQGNPFVLKIAVPEDDLCQGMKALELAQGRGYARIVRTAPEYRAVLLERLGRPLQDQNLAIDAQIEILCAALEKVWQPVPAQAGLASPQQTIGWFRGFIPDVWESLGRPCPEAVIKKALEYLSQREQALQAQPLCMLHGDANNTNLLEDPVEPGEYRFIDPDGICGEKAYDLGVLQREWVEEYEKDPVGNGLRRLELLHRLTGVDRSAIWQWGYIQCVSTGLVCLQIRYGDTGQRLLTVAEKWMDIPI